MGLFTKLDVNVEIDEQTFNVTVSNLTKEQQDTLKQKHGGIDTEWRDRAEIERNLGRKIERYQLLRSDGQNKEALSLLDEIEEIESKLGQENIEAVAQMLSDMYQSRFVMVISGPDKNRLRSYIDEHNMNYYEVMTHIEKKVGEAKKGKSIV